MAHYQQLSDQLIAPHLAEGRSFFYDPTTKQLRKEYAQYPAILQEGSRVLHDITEKPISFPRNSEWSKYTTVEGRSIFS